MEAMTPISPLERGGEMFTRAKTRSVFLDTWTRPESMATEFEGESEVGSDSESDDSPYNAITQELHNMEESRRRSQTTISSFDEVSTPVSGPGQRPLPLRLRSVEGPKGPHLFRSSQSSAELEYEFALQMSPMLPKQMEFQQPTPVLIPSQEFDFSIDAFVRHSDPHDARRWNSTQVIDWLIDAEVDAATIDCFERHDITGDVLLDLTFEDLKELGIESFGKRHQLWNALCVLQGRDGDISPIQTPFQDMSRPCTSKPRDTCETPIEGPQKKRRGRKQPDIQDVVSPAESVSIVAIEQLLPKPHKCNKGERCAKWRKQQRELKNLQQEHQHVEWPISPTKGGHIFVTGDPGNARTARNMLQPTHLPDEFYRPQSDAIPSVVASSDLLGPGQLPEFNLDEDMLNRLDKRDPQENVKAFLSFQHIQSPLSPMEDNLADAIMTPTQARAPALPAQPMDLFPAEHVPAFSAQSPMVPPSPIKPHQQLTRLPKLDIPRSSSAAGPRSAATEVRSATASPGGLHRFATPASEADIPITATTAPIQRNASQSVPPDMQFRDQKNARPQSRARNWRRPSLALESVKEHEVLSSNTSMPRPSLSSQRSGSSSTCRSTSFDSSSTRITIPDPSHHSPETKYFGYGAEVTQAGWMKKRRTKMLRHEWQDAHFRLKGTQLGMHSDEKYHTAAKETIDVEQYSVACSSGPSNSKLGAAFKSLAIMNGSPEKKGKAGDSTAFAFQLVPEAKERERLMGAKTHHFSVTSKDQRIDWMRELMLAKALQQKREGYEVEINGVQH